MSFKNNYSKRESLPSFDNSFTKESKRNDAKSCHVAFQPFTIHIVCKIGNLRKVSYSYKSLINILDPTLKEIVQFSEKESSSPVRDSCKVCYL